MNRENFPEIILKADRDRHVKNKHPWVFMGAVQDFPDFEPGAVLKVLTSQGEFVGFGYFNKTQSIAGRMFSFEETDPYQTIRESIVSAIKLRKQVIPKDTSAYRIINGEGDRLPGLVVDKYGDVLVLQINTLGIEKLKPLIIETLQEEMGKFPIFEKCSTATRKKEGLKDIEEWTVGKGNEPVAITEHGLKFNVSFTGMQKTGFFLDQREMRQLVRNYAKNKSVLNCFSYTGGFSVYALAGGAKKADSVDTAEIAQAQAKVNFELNGFSTTTNSFFTEDVADFLSSKVKQGDYDFIILDPPAFAKRASDIPNASRGYREINRLAMQKLASGSFLLTSSCSSHINRELFQTIIFQAAKDAKRKVKIISGHSLAADHPLDLFYPEGDYLKSLLLYIE